MEIFSSREKSISLADPTSHLPEPVVDCSVMIFMGEQSFSTDGEAGRGGECHRSVSAPH